MSDQQVHAPSPTGKALKPIHATAMAVIVVLCAVYLVSIPLGWVEQRLGMPEVILFALVLLFASGFIFTVEEFALSDKGVNFRTIRRVEARQDMQDREIARLRFLLSHFLTTHEIGHLKRLAGATPFPYDDFTHGSRFREELYRLRQHGLLQARDGGRMSTIPEAGADLRSRLEITPAGRQYLELLEEDAASG